MSIPSSLFKVIVVGGGPVGLTAAHALSRAGIDFLVLEGRPDVVADAGSNLVMSPVGLRALYQLGLFDELQQVTTPLGHISRLDHTGKSIGGVGWFQLMKDRYVEFNGMQNCIGEALTRLQVLVNTHEC